VKVYIEHIEKGKPTGRAHKVEVDTADMLVRTKQARFISYADAFRLEAIRENKWDDKAKARYNRKRGTLQTAK
jgi:hypothetical protein